MPGGGLFLAGGHDVSGLLSAVPHRRGYLPRGQPDRAEAWLLAIEQHNRPVLQVLLQASMSRDAGSKLQSHGRLPHWVPRDHVHQLPGGIQQDDLQWEQLPMQEVPEQSGKRVQADRIVHTVHRVLGVHDKVCTDGSEAGKELDINLLQDST